MLDSGVVGPGFKSKPRRCLNSLRQTVHTHHASVYQTAKLVAALLRVAGITAGLAESNGSRVYDSRHLQADCKEPRSAPEFYAGQSSMGYLYRFLLYGHRTTQPVRTISLLPPSRLTRSESQPRGSKQHSSVAGKVTEVLAARRPCARDRAVYGLNFLRKEDTSIRPHFCKDYVNVYICPLLCTQLNSTQPASTDAGVNISISASI